MVLSVAKYHIAGICYDFLQKLYLIRFAPLAFVPHCRIRSSQMPSLLVVFQGL